MYKPEINTAPYEALSFAEVVELKNYAEYMLLTMRRINETNYADAEIWQTRFNSLENEIERRYETLRTPQIADPVKTETFIRFTEGHVIRCNSAGDFELICPRIGNAIAATVPAKNAYTRRYCEGCGADIKHQE